jgi:hypothetical protein
MPAIATDPGQDDRHAGQPLHDHRQVVVDLGQVDVERRRGELAVVVELVGQADDVVVDVAEVDDLVGSISCLVAVGQLVEHLADRADRARTWMSSRLSAKSSLDVSGGRFLTTSSWTSSIASPIRSANGK